MEMNLLKKIKEITILQEKGTPMQRSRIESKPAVKILKFLKTKQRMRKVSVNKIEKYF